jgi:hypothetical protein
MEILQNTDIIVALLDNCIDILVQQCNCVCLEPKGLALEIKKRLDVHIVRSPSNVKNVCTEDTVSAPGTVDYCKVQQGIVASFFSQYSIGPPNKYNFYKSVHSNSVIDDSHHRLVWFKLCLDNLKEFCVSINKSNNKKVKVGFPYKIGCGMAGGKWEEDYLPMITKFTNDNSDIIQVIICKND